MVSNKFSYGDKVIIYGGDLAMDLQMRKYLFCENDMTNRIFTFLRLTKSGLAYLVNDSNEFVSVAIKNIYHYDKFYKEYFL